MKIENGNIKLKRGESFAVRVGVKIDGTPYEVKRADRIRMTVKRSMLETEAPVLERTTIGGDIIKIRSDDTSRLRPGKYRYEVCLIESDGAHHIVVDPHDFEITGG